MAKAAQTILVEQYASPIRRPGDHHFDGDFDGLGALVLAAIERRAPAQPR